MFMMVIFGRILIDESINFFNEERNYAVMLNIDWFQPFKYTNYSVGAIYMTILNLPRHLRFKKKCHSCWAYPRYEDRASYKYIY